MPPSNLTYVLVVFCGQYCEFDGTIRFLYNRSHPVDQAQSSYKCGILRKRMVADMFVSSRPTPSAATVLTWLCPECHINQIRKKSSYYKKYSNVPAARGMCSSSVSLSLARFSSLCTNKSYSCVCHLLFVSCVSLRISHKLSISMYLFWLNHQPLWIRVLLLPISWGLLHWHWTYESQLTYNDIARFIGPSWGQFGADRTQVGPILAPWILLSR